MTDKLSYKQRERLRREDEIITQARQLMMERGYANLNMDELAEKVGISKPTLYQHFSGKEDLAAKVLLNEFQAARANYKQPLEGTALQCLAVMLRQMMRTRHAFGNLLARFGFEVLSLMHTNPELRAYREEGFKFFSDLVDKAKAEGEVNEQIPTDIIVRSMFVLQSAVSDPFHKMGTVLEEADLEEAIEAVVRIFLKGITR